MEGDVTAASLSSDGQLIAVADESGEFKLFTCQESLLLHIERAHLDEVSAVAISPDNTLIVTTSCQGSILLWRAL